MQRVHRAVLDAVLIAGHQAAADAAVVGVLARIIQEVGVAVEALDDLRRDRGLLAEPDRHPEYEDVRGHHALEDLRPLVLLPSVLGHVGPHTDSDVVVDSADSLDLHAVAAYYL